TDLVYDVLRRHQPDHVLLRAARADAASGLLDIRRLGAMLSRIKGRIVHKALDHVSPLAVPVMLEIGRETVYGEASDELLADSAGALYWPDESVLVVADLHLEKGSSYAKRGVLLPPYDTAATLARLAQLIVRYAPRRVVALGDSFHDGDGPARVAPPDRTALA